MTALEYMSNQGINLSDEINGVIYVGANTGQEMKYLINMGLNHLVFFEPQPDSFESLKENAKKYGTRVIVENKAVGNIKGEMKLHIAANNGLSSSLLKPTEIHHQKYRISFTSEILVPVVRLDDYIKNPEYYNFLMIDVQGFELEVLKGSVNLLKNNIDYIMSEVNSVHLYENGVLLEELEDFLLQYNFKRIYISRDVEKMRKRQGYGDALYKKEK